MYRAWSKGFVSKYIALLMDVVYCTITIYNLNFLMFQKRYIRKVVGKWKTKSSLDITSRMWLTPVYPEKNTTHLENLSTRCWLITTCMKHVVCRSAVRARVYSLLKLKLFFQCVKFIHLHYTYAQCTYKVHMYLIMRATWIDKLVKL